jgi:hypothetical protein
LVSRARPSGARGGRLARCGRYLRPPSSLAPSAHGKVRTRQERPSVPPAHASPGRRPGRGPAPLRTSLRPPLRASRAPSASLRDRASSLVDPLASMARSAVDCTRALSGHRPASRTRGRPGRVLRDPTAAGTRRPSTGLSAIERRTVSEPAGVAWHRPQGACRGAAARRLS